MSANNSTNVVFKGFIDFEGPVTLEDTSGVIQSQSFNNFNCVPSAREIVHLNGYCAPDNTDIEISSNDMIPSKTTCVCTNGQYSCGPVQFPGNLQNSLNPMISIQNASFAHTNQIQGKALNICANDLETNITVSESKPAIGETISFTVSSTNHGPGDLTNTNMVSKLPVGLNYVSHIASHGTYDQATGKWSIGDFENESLKTLEITAQVDMGVTASSILTKVTDIQFDQIDNINNDNLEAIISLCPQETLNLTFNAIAGDLDARVRILSLGLPFNIDWGDSNNEPISGTLDHSYSSTGVKNISITGCMADMATLDLYQGGAANIVDSYFSGSLPNISSMTNLQSLRLMHHEFSGTIPPGYFDNNIELTDFSFHNNQITGTIPTGLLNNNTKLINAIFSTNQISGTIPVSFIDNNLTLEVFSLAQNNLTGTIPLNLFNNNAKLRTIHLHQNQLSGTLPSTIVTNNIDLENLTFSNNQFSGSIPAGIFDNNAKLEVLRLEHNQFNNGLSSTIFSNNPALTHLTFHQNQFNGPLPSGIFDNNVNLIHLLFHNNQITGSPNGFFDNNTSLEWLSFANNQFSGTLSNSIFDNNPNLTHLTFHGNLLNGALPTGVFDNNTALENLVFHNNQFSGALPAGVYDNNTSLEWLSFAHNQFNGSLSSTLFSSNPSLVHLSFQGNEFSGAMPVNLFSNNLDLEHLIFHNNNLTTGTSLANNNKLIYLNAINNNFNVSSINNFLIDLEANGAPGSPLATLGFQMHQQIPLAAPSGAGLTAKNNMITAGKNVLTDLNTAPVISDITNKSTAEDIFIDVPFTITDTTNPLNCSTNVAATGVDSLLISSITFSGTAPNCVARITPVSDANGTDSAITFTVSDGSLSDSDSFDLTITPTNDDPVISDITNTSTPEDTFIDISFMITDIDNTLNCSTDVTATGVDTLLVASINFSGTAPLCSARITPVAEASGIDAGIIFEVSDGTLSDTDSFDLTITAVNDPPEISDISNQSTPANTFIDISFTINDSDNNLNCSSDVSASGVDTGLIDTIVFSGTAPSCNARITPLNNQTGIDSSIIFTVTDGMYSDSDSFDLDIQCANETLNLAFNVVAGDLEGKVEVTSIGDPLNIDWGDGNSESINGSLTHTYSSIGTKNIAISGCFKDISELDLYQSTSSSDSYFNGSIPNISSMVNLSALYLGYNEFSGSLPAGAFDNNTNIRILSIRENMFSGTLPPNIFEHNSLLLSLNLINNQFNGTLPSGVFDNNINLTQLYLSNNQFSGTLPTGIFDNNTALDSLWLQGNQFSGSLPAGVFDNNTALTRLHFNGNQFSGALPTGIFDNNTALTLLYFNQNQFSGSLPAGVFDNNTALKNLYFQSNQFSGTLPTGIFDNNTALKSLWFQGNQFSGSLPAGVFDNNINLTQLYLSNNQFSGTLPTGIFDNNTALDSLWLQANQFSGSLPAGVFDNNTALKNLYFQSNQFSGALPPNLFDNNTALRTLQMGDNQFNGALPTGVFDNNTALITLSFKYNQFSGALPSALFDKNTALKSLTFSNNLFSGPLPLEIFKNNTSLTHLAFQSNQFSGTLPSGLFDNNTDLSTLYFMQNQFSGAMPVGLFNNNTALSDLRFSSNQFTTGTSLLNNNKLTMLHITGNNFDTIDINNFLIDLDTSNAPGTGFLGFNLSGQSPSAPPSGAGLTAKTNMINVKGINVITD